MNLIRGSFYFGFTGLCYVAGMTALVYGGGWWGAIFVAISFVMFPLSAVSTKIFNWLTS